MDAMVSTKGLEAAFGIIEEHLSPRSTDRVRGMFVRNLSQGVRCRFMSADGVPMIAMLKNGVPQVEVMRSHRDRATAHLVVCVNMANNAICTSARDAAAIA